MSSAAKTNNIPWSRVEEILAEQGKNQLWLRKQLDVEANVITHWKKRGVPSGRIWDLCRVLNVRPEHLTAERVQPYPHTDDALKLEDHRAEYSVVKADHKNVELIYASPKEISMLTAYREATKEEASLIDSAVETVQRLALGRRRIRNGADNKI